MNSSADTPSQQHLIININKQKCDAFHDTDLPLPCFQFRWTSKHKHTHTHPYKQPCVSNRAECKICKPHTHTVRLLTPASTRYLLSCVTGVSAFWQLIIAHHQSTIQFTGAHHQYTDIRHDKDNTHTHTSAAVPRVSIGNNIIIIGQHCTRVLSVPFPILSLAQLRVSIRVCWACALDRSVFTSVSSSSTFLIKPSTLRIVRD